MAIKKRNKELRPLYPAMTEKLVNIHIMIQNFMSKN